VTFAAASNDASMAPSGHDQTEEGGAAILM